MTETTEVTAIRLSPALQRFVTHWGEMGTRWGINRTVAQIHALLFVSPGPLPADVIAATLEVARSNVSTSLRELQAWGIVRMVHLKGDRRDHFESLKDVWEMFAVILEERRRREVDPTVGVLREVAGELKGSKGSDGHAALRIQELLEFFDAAVGVHQELRALPPSAWRRAARARRLVRDLLGRLGRG